MAIKLKQITDSGIEVEYHNIQNIIWIKGNKTRVSVASYINAEARKTKKPVKIKVYEVEGLSLSECYTYLKSRQFYFGEDC